MVQKKGTMITALRRGKYMTQNASHFKRSITVPEASNGDDKDDLMSDENVDANVNPNPGPATNDSKLCNRKQ